MLSCRRQTCVEYRCTQRGRPRRTLARLTSAGHGLPLGACINLERSSVAMWMSALSSAMHFALATKLRYVREVCRRGLVFFCVFHERAGSGPIAFVFGIHVHLSDQSFSMPRAAVVERASSCARQASI